MKKKYKGRNLGYLLLMGWFGLISTTGIGQQSEKMVWHDASTMFVAGKMNTLDTEPFQRFPANMKEKVREQVWRLSRNSAGLYLEFKTDAGDIEVQYGVENPHAFQHMPATGVSGVDLYAFDEDKNWQWVRGTYSFKDTITYSYNGIKPENRKTIKTYRLYLPLYNTLEWLKIGVPETSVFEDVKTITEQKPIVVYGTSIVQGGCASRAGMAWPAILGRQLGQPIRNLGFSGNGRLEPEIIDFMAQNQASLFVLDCMANFTLEGSLGAQEAEKRILKAVQDLRDKQPNVPILLVEHAGYSDGEMQPQRKKVYEALNIATQNAYAQLIAQKVKSIYLLEKAEMGLGEDSFVDGTHPNDHGMVKYAAAVGNSITKKIAVDGKTSE